MTSCYVGVTERIEIAYTGTLSASTAPSLYVNGVLSAVTVSINTATAGKVILSHSMAGRTVAEVLDYRGGSITVDGTAYPLVIDPRLVLHPSGDLQTIKGQTITCPSGVTVGKYLGPQLGMVSDRQMCTVYLNSGLQVWDDNIGQWVALGTAVWANCKFTSILEDQNAYSFGQPPDPAAAWLYLGPATAASFEDLTFGIVSLVPDQTYATAMKAGLGTIPASLATDVITAASVSAGAVTKIQTGLSTYAGGDTAGTTTLLQRIPQVIPMAQIGGTGAYYPKVLNSSGDVITAGLDAAGVRGAIGMAAADMDDQLDNIASSVGNLGAGAFSLTITVNDGTNVLEGASARLVYGATVLTGTTNASGQVVFACDAATWAVAITKAGYSFTPTTKVVSASGSQTYSMSAVVVPTPSAGQTTLYGYCYDEHGAPEQGVTISIVAKGVTGTGKAHDASVITATSDANGLASAFVPRGTTMTYSVRRGSGRWADVTGVDADTLAITSVLG